jgi:hypothetical protein
LAALLDLLHQLIAVARLFGEQSEDRRAHVTAARASTAPKERRERVAAEWVVAKGITSKRVAAERAASVVVPTAATSARVDIGPTAAAPKPEKCM